MCGIAGIVNFSLDQLDKVYEKNGLSKTDGFTGELYKMHKADIQNARNMYEAALKNANVEAPDKDPEESTED